MSRIRYRIYDRAVFLSVLIIDVSFIAIRLVAALHWPYRVRSTHLE